MERVFCPTTTRPTTSRPTDILPHGHFAPQTFRSTDISPHGQFALGRVVREPWKELPSRKPENGTNMLASLAKRPLLTTTTRTPGCVSSEAPTTSTQTTSSSGSEHQCHKWNFYKIGTQGTRDFGVAELAVLIGLGVHGLGVPGPAAMINVNFAVILRGHKVALGP